MWRSARSPDAALGCSGSRVRRQGQGSDVHEGAALPDGSVLPLREQPDDDPRGFDGNPLLSGVRRADLEAQAYAEMLGRQSWHWFVTLTFRPSHEGRSGGMHPEKADKAFRVLVSKINRSIYGTRWYKRDETQLVWARGQEFHKSGRIHFHAVMADPRNDLNALARRMQWVDWWWQEFGIARIERPESQADICGYVSKYVTKDGEVDFSPNFGRVVPPALQFRDAATPKRTSNTSAPGEVAMRTSGQQNGTASAASRCLTLPLRPEFAIHHQSITRAERENENGEDYDQGPGDHP